MNTKVLAVSAGNLPAGYCATSLQDMASTFAAAYSVNVPVSGSGVYVSSTPPADETLFWGKIDSQGRYVGGYIYAQGAWLSPHPILPGMIQIYPFATPDFNTFDGGDANALGPASGPMWQLPLDGSGNPILRAQFPLGQGTLPSGKIINPGDAGGEENHVLMMDEMPAHRHNYGIDPVINTPACYITYGQGYQLASSVNIDNGTVIKQTATGLAGGDGTAANATVGHNTMPPYYGVCYLQRTNRLFYRGT